MDETQTEDKQVEDKKSGGMNGLLIGGVLVLLLVGGYYFMNQGKSEAPIENQMPAPGSVTVPEMVVEDTTGEGEEVIVELDEDGNQSVEVEGGMFYFQPNRLIVKKGVPVKVTLNNVEGMHDFVIDELDVQSEVIAAGKSTIVEFTPKEAGEFEFYCSIGDHRAKGMVGTLVVE